MTEMGLRIADATNSLEPQGHDRNLVDVGRIVATLRRRRKAILFSILVWVGLGLANLMTSPPVYTAAATVMLDGNLNRPVEGLTPAITTTLSDGDLESAIMVIQSDAIAETVVDKLNLTQDQAFLAPPTSALAKGLGFVIDVIRMPFAHNNPAAKPDDAAAVRHAVSQYLTTKLQIDRVGRSTVFSISYTNHDPELAAKVVNAFADAYSADVLNANFDSTQRMTEWLQSRLQDLEAQSRNAAEAAQTFRMKNGLASSGGELLSEGAVTKLNTDLAAAISTVASSRALVSNYEAVVADGPAGLIAGKTGSFSTDDPALMATQQRLSDALANQDRIRRDYGTDHPQAKIADQVAAAAAERLFLELNRRLQNARSQLVAAQAQESSLRDSLSSAIQENGANGAAQIEMRALDQRAATLSTLYETFLGRAQETAQQKTAPVSNVRILSQADVPIKPSGPSKTLTMAAAIFLGLITGTLIVAFREWNERFLRTGEEVQLELGQHFLGYLPLFSVTNKPDDVDLRKGAELVPQTIVRAPDRPGREVLRHSVYVFEHMRSIYAETLRNVRLAASIRIGTSPCGVVGITSVRPGEGKSSVALNFAGMLAADGSRVLLLDCDAREPGLSRNLGVTKGAGLIEVLLGKVGWEEAICEVGTSRIHVLPCISPVGFTHSSELLGSKAMRSLLDDARKSYDFIVLDMAPVGPVIDARILMRAVTCVVMVAEWGKTPTTLVHSVLGSDPHLAQCLIGVVLNKVDMIKLRDFVDVSNVVNYYDEYGSYLTGVSGS
jgi:succinoglycan biosynthesis transport protein ExoP